MPTFANILSVATLQIVCNKVTKRSQGYISYKR
ncbi:unnamed protein product [Fructobacillus cardui]|uniref:Uncharacterized protein n=1 Tax=Fructobacillus cardui TaxID=2893170 RepID=A0ABM9MQ21_9LACO|nr:unnamed protein product [Fructobacillus cardui]